MKKHDFPSDSDTHDTYHCTREEYCLLLRNFLNPTKLRNFVLTKNCLGNS